MSSAHHVSGHRLWRLSFQFCHSAYVRTYMHKYIHTNIHTYMHTCTYTVICTHTYVHTYRNESVSSSFHCIISLGAACGDSVFCCSGTASADPCDFISFHRIISLGTACGDSVFCSVTDFCESWGAASGDPLISVEFVVSCLWG